MKQGLSSHHNRLSLLFDLASKTSPLRQQLQPPAYSLQPLPRLQGVSAFRKPVLLTLLLAVLHRLMIGAMR